MGIIQRLPTELALKIAAGEVVDRPASVVKELLDNALDAQSTSIRVEIENAGASLIRVTDNGCGIAREDVPMALERHATSKIREVTDLASVITMGFRGEALAAISSVAEMEILTRRAEDLAGTRLHRLPGGEPVIEDAGCPAGTTLSIRDLFKNVPARKKFLKAETTEFKHIHDAVLRASLAWERVHFLLVHNGKKVFEAPRGGDRGDRVRNILGKRVFEELHPVSHTAREVVVEGFVSRPSFTRPTSGHIMTFVNDRFIQNKTVLAAVTEAYRGAIEPRRYPTGILYLEMDPAAIDINVHPSKMEIKFVDERAVFRGILAAVKSAITGETLATPHAPPRVSSTPERPSPAREEARPSRETPAVLARPTDRVMDAPGPLTPPGPSMIGHSPAKKPASDNKRDLEYERDFRQAIHSHLSGGDSSPESAAAGDSPDEAEQTPAAAGPAPPDGSAPPAAPSTPDGSAPPAVPGRRQHSHHLGPIRDDPDTAKIWGAYRAGEMEIRPIGQALNLYIVGEMGNSVVFIDQHAAHERILYEKFRRQLNSEVIPRQSLIFPLTLDLSAADAALLADQAETFREMGFEIRPFGENAFIVDTIPADLTPESAEALLRDLADDLRDGFKQWAPEDRREHMLATMACRAAIKAGDPLSGDDIRALVHQINRLNEPETCPHGRPKVIVFTDDELRRQFKRK